MTPVRANPQPLSLKSSTLPLSHCAPYSYLPWSHQLTALAGNAYVKGAREGGGREEVSLHDVTSLGHTNLPISIQL